MWPGWIAADWALTVKPCSTFEHDAGIIADPGAEYGAAGFYRWNIATTRQNLEVALSQLEGAYQKNFNDMEVQR